jgi:hypothetical protein
MAADHSVAMKNLQVTEFVVWPKLPADPAKGAMIVKMGRQ